MKDSRQLTRSRRRAPGAGHESEIVALLLEHVLEHRKIDPGAQAFQAPDRVKRLLEFAVLGDEFVVPKPADEAGEFSGRFRQLLSVRLVFGFPPCPQHVGSGILQLPGNELAGNAGGVPRTVRGGVLRPAQQVARVAAPQYLRQEVAVLCVVVDGHLMIPAQGHGRRRHHHPSKRADAFQVVNGDGQAGFFLDLHPERQMIPGDHGPRRRQVEGVLNHSHGVSFASFDRVSGNSDRPYRILPGQLAPVWAGNW